MTKFIIEYDRDNCIGAGPCEAVAEKFWQIKADGKADLIGSKREGDLLILEIDDKDLDINKLAAESCPVNVIKIKNKETGEYL